MSAFVDTLAYAADETPWHQRGTAADVAIQFDTEAFKKLAGLDWTVEKRPVFWADEAGHHHILPGQFTIVESKKGQPIGTWSENLTGDLRQGDHLDGFDVLGDGVTVGKKYVEFQNDALFALGESIIQEGEGRWVTAGSLKGKRKVWAQLQLSGGIETVRRDGTVEKSAPYLLLFNSHDGSSHLTGRIVWLRVVCNNTAQAALAGDAKSEFKLRHSGDLKAKAVEAANILKAANDLSVKDGEIIQGLADTPFSQTQFRDFVCQLLTGKDDVEEAKKIVSASEGRSRTIYANKGETLFSLFKQGQGNHGEDAYDALNAVTEYIDHARNRGADFSGLTTEQQDVVVDSSLFGNGHRVKQRAVKLLLDATGAEVEVETEEYVNDGAQDLAGLLNRPAGAAVQS